MKKLLLLLTAAMLLGGCHAGRDNETASEYFGELSKAQEIAVIPADASAAAQVLTEGEEISDFIFVLDMEQWEWKPLPKEAEFVGIFRFSQEETIQLGERAADGELHPVCEVLSYADIPYVTLKIAGTEMTFQVPDEAAEALAEYFR